MFVQVIHHIFHLLTDIEFLPFHHDGLLHKGTREGRQGFQQGPGGIRMQLPQPAVRKIRFAGMVLRCLFLEGGQLTCHLLETLQFRQSLGFTSGMAYSFLYWTILYNVWFGFFNLIPIPPLDGSKILETFLSYEAAYQYDSMVSRYGFWLLILICYSGIANYIIGPLAQLYLNLCFRVAGILF